MSYKVLTASSASSIHPRKTDLHAVVFAYREDPSGQENETVPAKIYASRTSVTADEILELQAMLEQLPTQNNDAFMAEFTATLREQAKFTELDPLSQLELNHPQRQQDWLRSDIQSARGTSTERFIIEEHWPSFVREVLENHHAAALLEELFSEAQQKDLFLVDTKNADANVYDGTGKISYKALREAGKVIHTSLSAAPVFLSEEQEANIAEMVETVTLCKLAILDNVTSDPDLQKLLLSGLSEISKEICFANLNDLTTALRLRYDTFCSQAPGVLGSFELNGNEPQGDAQSSKNFLILKEVISHHLKELGAKQDDIDYCFEPLKIPMYAVGEEIVKIYKDFIEQCNALPYEPVVGFLAWKDRKKNIPFSPISNVEAQSSAEYFRKMPGIGDTCFFDPFDITGFKEFESLDGKRFILPVVTFQREDREPIEHTIHFIRRLSGSLLSKGFNTWRLLKKKKPEIYYKFVGIKDEQYNPDGLRIPNALWMNPLTPLMTDKKLDAIVSTPSICDRFNVQSALEKRLGSLHPQMTVEQVKDLAKATLRKSRSFIPKSYILSLQGVRGLFPEDSNFTTSLTEDELQKIKNNRHKYVLKQNALTGFSGKGVFVGKNFSLSELDASCRAQLPEELQQELKHRSGLSRHDLNLLRDKVWPYLVDYALHVGDCIVQETLESQYATVVPVTTSIADGTTTIHEPRQAEIDINPRAIGPKKTDIHSRFLMKGEKTNVTSGGAGRVAVFPRETVKRLLALWRTLHAPTLDAVADDRHQV
jgi:hypothetical protein